MKHTITISKDGKSSLKTEYGSSRGYQEKDLGTIGVDVEIVDLRDTFERWVDPVQQERTRIIEEVEKMRKYHKEFECNGAHNGKGCFEDFCEDQNCKNAPKEYNQALTDIINIIKNK